MTTEFPSARLGALASVSLADVQRDADLQTRVDRKYVVHAGELDRLLGRLAGLRALEIDGRRAFAYESVYFDTPGLDAYLRAARGRPDRFKVRTRTYLDTGACALEVKVRDRVDRTVKHRTPYAPVHRRRITGGGQAFVAERLLLPEGAPLHPVLTTRYRRATIVGTGVRVTVDAGLVCVGPDGRSIALADELVLETKSGGRATEIDRLLWSCGHRPVRISKYAVGMAGLDPSLPANRWNRVLRRHFSWTPRDRGGLRLAELPRHRSWPG